MIKSIVFLMTTNGIGGEVITYLRIAEWLHKNTDYKIYCADLPNGASLSYIKKQGYDYINIIRMNVSRDKKSGALKLEDTVFPDNCAVFTNGFFLLQNSVLKHIKAQNVRFLFYFVEPHTFYDAIQKKSLLKRIKCRMKLAKYLKTADCKKALLFQDYPNFKGVQKYYSKLHKQYLPIPIAINLPRPDWEIAPDRLNFCYIGRDCPSKNTTLMFYAKQASRYAQQNPNLSVVLYVVSDINKNYAIRKKLTQRYANIKIVFKGTLYDNKLEAFLKQKIDIVLGMEVSCLEAAKLGIAAISAPASLKSIPVKTKVGMISGFNEYSLGGYLNENKALTEGFLFADLVDNIRSNYNRCIFSNYEFANLHYGIGNVMPRLLEYIKETSFYYDDLGK